MLSLPKLNNMKEREVRPSMDFLSLLHDKLGDDVLYCNLLRFQILVSNSTGIVLVILCLWATTVSYLLIWWICWRWYCLWISPLLNCLFELVSEVVAIPFLWVYGAVVSICFAMINIAAISASVADAITVLIICAIFKTGPLSFGLDSFSESNICGPALLIALDLLRNPASAYAANIISLFLNRILSLSYVATYSRSFSIAAVVSSVDADCWAPISINATGSLLLTALPTYSKSPTMPWILLIPFSFRIRLVSVGFTSCCVVHNRWGGVCVVNNVVF